MDTLNRMISATAHHFKRSHREMSIDESGLFYIDSYINDYKLSLINEAKYAGRLTKVLAFAAGECFIAKHGGYWHYKRSYKKVLKLETIELDLIRIVRRMIRGKSKMSLVTLYRAIQEASDYRTILN